MNISSNHEQSAIKALLNKRINPGDVIIIRYQGPRAVGMPEMFFISELIASDPVLSVTTSLITDGRFSGASRGPCIGYLCPEAIDGGPIAFVEDDDFISVDIPNRNISIVGILGKMKNEKVVETNIRGTKMDFILPDIRHKGIPGQYTKMAKRS